mmetsp:Transcript_3447/g.9950  ORF Transcript_3447/g.9950 Transcript_3447/m.9950 type:complete len:886 (+) Transcript_3447:71-2728(+)
MVAAGGGQLRAIAAQWLPHTRAHCFLVSAVFLVIGIQRWPSYDECNGMLPRISGKSCPQDMRSVPLELLLKGAVTRAIGDANVSDAVQGSNNRADDGRADGGGAEPEKDRKSSTADSGGADAKDAFAKALVIGAAASTSAAPQPPATTTAPTATSPFRAASPSMTTAPTTLAPTVSALSEAAPSEGRSAIFDSWARSNKWFDRVAALQADCSLKEEDVPVKPGGGFASKFQLIAGKAMRSFKKGLAVRLVGHLGGYSEIEPCRKALGDEVYNKVGSFRCYFRAERPCAAGAVTSPGAREASKEAIAAFKALTEKEEEKAFQALEAYLFRPNDDTIRSFLEREAKIGFDDRQLEFLVGVHVRRGDKVVDPYNRYYTTREYAEAVVNWAVGAKLCAGPPKKMNVYIASDSALVKGELRTLLQRVKAGKCSLMVIGMDSSVSQTASDSHRFDRPGEIQGMAGKVALMKGDEAKQAALDILFDIYMLSRADLLVGSLSSQIGRIAAGLRLAVGFRSEYHPPLAMDYKNWQAVSGMGRADGIPSTLSEGWVATPKVELSLGDSSFAEGNELLGLVCAIQGGRSEAQDVHLDGRGELAEQLLRAAELATQALRKGVAVRFLGHFGGYSLNPVCAEIIGKDVYDEVGSFSCYFERERVCAPPASAKAAASADAAAAIQRALGGVAGSEALNNIVLAYMLRPTQETVAEYMKREWIARISDVKSPFLGVQIFGANAAHKPEHAPSADEIVAVLKLWAKKEGGDGACTVYVASDTDEAVKALQGSLGGKKSGRCTFTVTGLSEYWAHHHKPEGWPGKLTQVEGRWATRDILFDISVLSRADVLIGARSSPLACAAARLRAAMHPEVAARQPPIALDLGAGAGPSPEGWVAPPAA